MTRYHYDPGVAFTLSVGDTAAVCGAVAPPHEPTKSGAAAGGAAVAAHVARTGATHVRRTARRANRARAGCLRLAVIEAARRHAGCEFTG